MRFREENLAEILENTCDCSKFQPHQFEKLKTAVTERSWSIPEGGGCAGSIRFGDLMLDVLAYQGRTKGEDADVKLAYFVQSDRIHADHIISPAICYRMAHLEQIASKDRLAQMSYDRFLTATISQVARVVKNRESFQEPAMHDTGFWKIIDLANNRPPDTKVTEQEAQKELEKTLQSFLVKCRSVGLTKGELGRVVQGASSSILKDYKRHVEGR